MLQSLYTAGIDSTLHFSLVYTENVGIVINLLEWLCNIPYQPKSTIGCWSMGKGGDAGAVNYAKDGAFDRNYLNVELLLLAFHFILEKAIGRYLSNKFREERK